MHFVNVINWKSRMRALSLLFLATHVVCMYVDPTGGNDRYGSDDVRAGGALMKFPGALVLRGVHMSDDGLCKMYLSAFVV